MSMSFRSLLVGAAVVSAGLAIGENMTYYPNGDTADAPYLWSTAANWGTSAKTPTVLNRVPTSEDAVYLSADQLATSPLVIESDGDITVSAMTLAAGDNDGATPNALYGKGQGTWLQLMGGNLNVLGALSMANKNYNYGRLDILGGKLSAGSFSAGVNAYATSPTVIHVAKGAEFDVAGSFWLGRRSQRSEVVLTNNGMIVAQDMCIGANSSSYVSKLSEFVNFGTLVISNDVTLVSTAKSASYGYLYLKEGSSIRFEGTGTHKFNFAGANGYGYLDTEIDLDFTTGAYSLNFGASGHGYYVGRKTAHAKAATLDFPAVQNGKAAIELHDNAVFSVTNLINEYAATVSALDLHDHSMMTNVQRMALGYPVGSRSGADVHFTLRDDSVLAMDPDSEAKIFGGTQKNGWMDIALYDRAVIRNVKSLMIAAGTVKDSAGATLGGRLDLRGGTVEFLPTADSALTLGTSGSTNSLSLCGYGKVTRTDIADPDLSLAVNLEIPNPQNWAVTADGEGVARDLDLRAIKRANDKATYKNKSGTNGWYAVNKGRLIYPRAFAVGSTSTHTIRGIGDFPQLGTTGVPKYVNSFTVSFPKKMGADFGYFYAELYAADREDIPADLPAQKPEDALAVVKLGVNTAANGWTSDDPTNPINFGSVTVNYCYPTNSIREATDRVVVYHHPGTSGGRWHRVGRTMDKMAGTVATSALPPVEGADWNIGWLAVVAEEPKGLTIIVK